MRPWSFWVSRPDDDASIYQLNNELGTDEFRCLAETLFAVYPIFAFMPVEKGGLGLSEARIGIHMSVRAVTQILAMIPYPYLERRFGFVRMYTFSMLLWPAMIALFPVLNLVARRNGEDGWIWYGALFVFFMVWAFTGWAWSKCDPPLLPLILTSLFSWDVYHGQQFQSKRRCSQFHQQLVQASPDFTLYSRLFASTRSFQHFYNPP